MRIGQRIYKESKKMFWNKKKKTQNKQKFKMYSNYSFDKEILTKIFLAPLTEEQRTICQKHILYESFNKFCDLIKNDMFLLILMRCVCEDRARKREGHVH